MKENTSAKTCKIMVVEDDEDDFYFIHQTLSSVTKSINVLHSINGIMFSSIIQSSYVPDIIFIDINMPFKNGIACLKEVRSLQQYNQTKVVMYSTSGSVKDIDICYTAGANFYLIKPCTNKSAIQQMRDLFENEYFVANSRPPIDQFVHDSISWKELAGCKKMVAA